MQIETSFLRLTEPEDILSFFASASGATSNYTQFSSGSADLSYRMDSLDGIQILWGHSKPWARYTDIASGDKLHLGFSTASKNPVKARGIDITPQHAMVWIPGYEMESICRGETSTCEISIDGALCRSMGWHPDGEPVRRLPEDTFGDLRRACDYVALVGDSASPDEAMIRTARNRLIDAIDGLLHPWLTNARVEQEAASYRLVRKGETFIRKADPSEPFSVDDLVDYIGAPRRSVFHAYRSNLGVSPRKYFEFIRLQKLRQSLRTRKSETYSVLQASLEHGFTDCGRMAALYRNRFGENPRQTLIG